MAGKDIRRGNSTRRGNGGGIWRRGSALALTAGTLWLVWVTAGSEDAGAAVRSLREAAVVTVLREELAGLPDSLSVPVALALHQAPLLYSAGDGALWDGAEAGENVPGGTPEPNAKNAPDAENGLEAKNGPDAENGLEAKNGPDAENIPDAETVPDRTADADNVPDAASVTEGKNAPDGQGAPDGQPEGTEAPAPDRPVPGTGEALREAAAEPSKEPTEAGGTEAPSYQAAVENGMRARTLIPSGPDGYTVAGRVYISSSRKDRLDVSALLDTFDAHLTGEAPQILILHSHGSEAYTPVPGTEVVWSGDHRTTDPRYSVVKCGDVMAAAFGAAGISVLHDRTLYDYPEYTGSYDRSLAAINSYLAQYPSIHFILDVHRDSISDGAGNQYKVLSEIEGTGAAAQLTLVVGSDGSGAAHPRWMENLKLAVAVQEQICGKYPTLMRPLLLRKSRYNQHTTTGSLLVEVGASGNAPEEAQLAARLFAEEMAEVLLARTK